MTTYERIENVRTELRLNKGEICERLGIGRTMYHYLKTGERELSPKAGRVLEELEREVAGYIQREKRSASMVQESADIAKQYSTKTEMDLAFKAELSDRQAEEYRRRLEEVENERDTLADEMRNIQDRIKLVLDTKELPYREKALKSKKSADSHLKERRGDTSHLSYEPIDPLVEEREKGSSGGSG